MKRANRELHKRAGDLLYKLEGFQERNEPTPPELSSQVDEVIAELDAADLSKSAGGFRDGQGRPQSGQTPPPPVPVARSQTQRASTEYDAWRANYEAVTGGPEYRDALTAYLASAFRPNLYGHAQQDVLAGGIDEEGGFLLPTEFVDGIMGRRPTPSHVFDKVAHRKTARESVTLRRWQKDASDPSEYTSQLVPTWVAEIPASGAGEVTPKVGLVKVSVDKARIKVPIGRDELADTDVDLIREIEEAAAPNMRAFMDLAIIDGTGIDQPLGLLRDPDIITNAAATDVSGSTADQISNTTTDLGSATKLMDLQKDLPVQYRERAAWVMSPDSENRIRQLIDAQNRFLWGTGLDANPKTLLGDPVIISPWANSGGTDGDIIIIYGDLEAAYQAVIRDEIAAQLDPFSKADVEQVILYLRFRLGGRVKNVDAVRLGKV